MNTKLEIKEFLGNNSNFPSLNSITSDNGKRVYIDDNNSQYKSVTTFLSETGDKSFLEAWKSRVGEEEATRISNESTSIGTKFHKLIENHFDSSTIDNDDSIEFRLFKSVESILNKIEYINGEQTVYSNKMKLAGRFDCLGYYDGKLSIIDFKNSRKYKRLDWIDDYILQCMIYSYMIWELFSIEIEQIVIIIGVWKDFKPQVFSIKTSQLNQYKIKLKDRLRKMNET